MRRWVFPAVLLASAAFAQGGGDGEAYQRIAAEGGGYRVEYGFRNFNQDDLEVSAFLPRGAVEEAISEFGFRTSDFNAVDAWYQSERGRILGGGGGDRQLAALTDEYRRRRVEIYSRAGFRYKDARTVEPDVPNIVRGNVPRMEPVARAFSKIAVERGYGADELVGAVSAMAETAIRYEIPALYEGERVTDGMQPPPQVFVSGQGDCITKSGLIGAVLGSWPKIKMVGLAIPTHYLLAVHRMPARGEVYVEYEGLPYVLIDPAGPAWIPPGQVGEFTNRYLNSNGVFRIQPFFQGG